MRKVLFLITSVAIAIALVLLHSTLAVSQSESKPDLPVDAATRLEAIATVERELAESPQ